MTCEYYLSFCPSDSGSWHILYFLSFIYFIKYIISFTQIHSLQNIRPGGALSKKCFEQFCKLQGKHMLQRVSFTIKLQAFKEAPTQVLSCEFCKTFKNNFLLNTPGSYFCYFKSQNSGNLLFLQLTH